MPYVFGSDYSGVSSARTNADQMNIGVQQAEAARRDQAARDYANQLARQQEAQIQQETARQANLFNFGMQQQGRQDRLLKDATARGDTLSENNLRHTTDAYQFGVKQANVAADRVFNEKYATANQTEHKADKADMRSENAYKDAFNLVDKGLITTPEQLDNVPDLLPQHRDILKSYVSKADLAAAVQEANATLASDPDFKSTASPYLKGTGWMFPTPDIEGAARNAVLKNPRIAARLGQMVWNPNTKQFAPASFQSVGAPAPAAAPATPATVPVIPPTAGTSNTGYTFPPVAMAPAPSTVNIPPPGGAWQAAPVFGQQPSTNAPVGMFGQPVPGLAAPVVTAPPQTGTTIAPAAPPGKIRVRNPQGIPGSVTPEQLNAALAKGYTLAL